MNEPSQTDNENRGLAMASLSLVRAVMDVLEKKGVLAADDVQAIFDQALTTLEYRAQDKATDLARRIIEAAVITRAAQSPKEPE